MGAGRRRRSVTPVTQAPILADFAARVVRSSAWAEHGTRALRIRCWCCRVVLSASARPRETRVSGAIAKPLSLDPSPNSEVAWSLASSVIAAGDEHA